jgi:hypothetical protein
VWSVGVVYRDKLTAPANESVAKHDLVSELYHVNRGHGDADARETYPGSRSARYSPEYTPPLIATTMYCLPSMR